MEADRNGSGGLLYNGIDVGALLSLLREKILRIFTSNMTKDFAAESNPPTYPPPSTVRAAVFWDDESEGGLFVELVGIPTVQVSGTSGCSVKWAAIPAGTAWKRRTCNVFLR